MKFIHKHKFQIIGILIVIASNVWYWFFGLRSGDLVQIIAGLCWVIMSLMFIMSGMETDWIVEDERARKLKEEKK
jgi:uncharacterized membrane protein